MVRAVELFSIILPISYAVLGYLFWKKTPKLIGGKSGWRTGNATKNEESWRFANEVGGKGLFILGISEFIITLIIHLLIGRLEIYYFVAILSDVIVLQSTSFTLLHKYIEKKLKSL